MIKIKLTSNIKFIFLIILFYSCKNKNESYLLKNKNGEIIEIVNHEDKLSIFEYDNTKKLLLRDLVKVNNEYYDIDILKKNTNKSNSHLFLSKNKFLVVDRHSLLNDSMIIGNKEYGFFYTEIKSNNKPVIFKYYYNNSYEIKKIKIIIGKNIQIYE